MILNIEIDVEIVEIAIKNFCCLFLQEACKFLGQPLTNDINLATGLYQVANLYYNWTGDQTTFCANYANCVDSAVSALGSPLGWPWQVQYILPP